MTPKIIFKILPILIETNLLYEFLLKSNRDKFILQWHPKLSHVFEIKNKKEQLRFIKNYIITLRNKDKRVIKKNKKEFQDEWKKIEKKAFTVLSEVIEMAWPKKRKQIVVFLSINPVCPRFLNSWTCNIFYKFDIDQAKEVILHECCHFLYFQKWKLLFPKSKTKTFETPYIEWHLSEIMAPIILNDSK